MKHKYITQNSTVETKGAMTTTNEPIDFEFGLRQLNGNEALLHRLLRKFADEYRDIGTRLPALLSAQDIAGAEILVHTLKGVSGNLGCNAVFEASRSINQQLKASDVNNNDIADLLQQVNQTIALIDALPSGDDATNSTSEEKPESKIALQALTVALNNHEFISNDKLNSWLDAMAASPMQRQQITNAIDELDYDAAKALLSELA